MQLVRGAVLIGSSACFFSALHFLPLAEATALNYTSPILVTLMAAWLLQERLTRPRWAFIIAGFVGMLLIVRPGSDMLTPAALFALGAALLYAIFQILTRKLAGENLMVLLAYPSVIGTAALSLIVPFFFRDDAWYPMVDTAAFVSIGAIGFLGHYLFIRAFQRALRPPRSRRSPTRSSCGRRLPAGWCSDLSGRVDACGDRGHRRQRRHPDLVRALARRPAAVRAGSGRLTIKLVWPPDQSRRHPSGEQT